VIPPSWVDPYRRPLRNQLPAAIQAALALGRQLAAHDQTVDGTGVHEPEPP
jgi:hypothetical protein